MMKPDTSEWKPITREHAASTGWIFRDNGYGTITRALDEWIITDREQRSFMTFSLMLANAHWTKISDQVATMPTFDSGPDHSDLLFDRLDGLMPHDYEWMLFSGILKDAVTAYEVYLANAMDEVLLRQGLQRKDKSTAPSRLELEGFYAVLGLKPQAQGVSHVVRLRNLLTHVRGRLHNSKERARYGRGSGVFVGDIAHLDERRVLRHMETLGRAIHRLDPVLWAYAWKRGSQIPPELIITETVEEAPPRNPGLERFADLVPE
ncbi:MAG: hypothetical protein ACJ74U_09000 [Jatrophihabitantaceae bacterium]